MKKLVLTMVALVAMATTSFAQYSDFEQILMIFTLQVAYLVYHSTYPVYHIVFQVQ